VCVRTKKPSQRMTGQYANKPTLRWLDLQHQLWGSSSIKTQALLPLIACLPNAGDHAVRAHPEAPMQRQLLLKSMPLLLSTRCCWWTTRPDLQLRSAIAKGIMIVAFWLLTNLAQERAIWTQILVWELIEALEALEWRNKEGCIEQKPLPTTHMTPTQPQLGKSW
jgi:hypothetical protein